MSSSAQLGQAYGNATLEKKQRKPKNMIEIALMIFMNLMVLTALISAVLQGAFCTHPQGFKRSAETGTVKLDLTQHFFLHSG
ncbi:hypothetical protein AAY55_10415 [Vibrio metoecus]|uniref:Uncharacterized protein n=1 Tax=Vibrio metoecus TaxID=1481663 RepID=A0A0Q0JQ58_VIBMT|nr:hypothetical protein AAY55_10415 [Vibrio metoecus]